MKTLLTILAVLLATVVAAQPVTPIRNLLPNCDPSPPIGACPSQYYFCLDTSTTPDSIKRCTVPNTWANVTADGGDELLVNNAATTTPNLADSAYSKYIVCTGSEAPDPECANPNEIISWAEDIFSPSVGSGQIMFESPITTGVDGNAHLAYTEPAGSLGGKVVFDTGSTVTPDTLSRLRTQIVWDLDDARGPNAAYSRTLTAHSINARTCIGGSRPGLPCWVDGDCPGGTCTAGADPLGQADWVWSENFNLSESAEATVPDTTWWSRNHTWENPYWDGSDWWTEYISHYYSDDGTGSSPGTETGFWHMGLRGSGRCGSATTGGRAGLICLPGGGPDNDPNGATYGCPGTGANQGCEGWGNGLWTMNIGSWGFCTTSPKTLCLVNADCPSSDCNRSALNNAYMSIRSDWATKANNNLTSNRLIFVEPAAWLFAGDVPTGGIAGAEVVVRTAPQAADIDGSVYGMLFTANLGTNAESTSQLAALTGLRARVDYNPDDNNADMSAAYAIHADALLRPTGDSGTMDNTDATDNNIDEVTNFRSTKSTASAVDQAVLFFYDFKLERPTGVAGDSKVYYHQGINIEDQCPATNATNWGPNGHHAVLVQPSSCSSASKNNLAFDDQNNTDTGGRWNNGHLAIGDLHVWTDGTSLYAKNGVPTGATDGTNVMAGDISDVYGCASGDCADIALADADSLDMSATPGAGWTTGEGLRLSQAATCTGTADTGAICYGTTAKELCVYNGAGWDCQTLGASNEEHPFQCKTVYIADADANIPLDSFPSGLSLLTGWCQCIGPSCATPAVISFENDDGTPATIGGGSATCTARSSGDPTAVTFSGGEEILGTYSVLRFDEGAGTPTAGDSYMVCWSW